MPSTSPEPTSRSTATATPRCGWWTHCSMRADMPGPDPPRLPIAYVTTVALSVRRLFTNQLRHLQRCGFDITAISGGGDALAAVRTQGVRHLLVPFTRRMSPIRDLHAT